MNFSSTTGAYVRENILYNVNKPSSQQRHVILVLKLMGLLHTDQHNGKRSDTSVNHLV